MYNAKAQFIYPAPCLGQINAKFATAHFLFKNQSSDKQECAISY
jgi:hypothetical protein